jgi:predicted secreted Zn-dependent protease
MTMKWTVRRILVAACILPWLYGASHAADGVTVTEKHFAISGSTGAALYASIGRNGPDNAIAHTTYTLTWSRRRLVPEGGGCRLADARPTVAITYTFPKPEGKLPPVTAKRWTTFIAGVREHEEVHGEMIREMLARLQATIAGLGTTSDPGCRKAKREMTRLVKEATTAHKERSRAFDRVEMSAGGTIQRLVMALVNEPLGKAAP